MAEYIEIIGGRALSGTIQVSGAKNAALPMIMASLLTSEKIELTNVPNLHDVGLTLHLLETFGALSEYSSGKVVVSVPELIASEASYSLVKALRASFWILAPLLARGGAARVALPGGDIIGARPVDMHLAALTQMGADLQVKHGVVYATAPHGLKPSNISFRFPSVGATHQVLMAAALTPGTTTITGAAREPEVIALAELLTAMGAEVEGAGSPNIVIHGKRELGGASKRIIGDRIEAGTFLLAAAVTRGTVKVEGINPEYLGEFKDVLVRMGLDLTFGDNFVAVKSTGRIKATDLLTAPFPGLATDLQAPLCAALCFADGVSHIEESIFEGRFAHVSELCRMGAQISVNDRIAEITGSQTLTGAEVEGLDIRAAASLVIAALGAHGTSIIYEPYHLSRGYEKLEAKLASLGASIGKKESDMEDFAFTGC